MASSDATDPSGSMDAHPPGDARRRTLISSLRLRFVEAERCGDAQAKQDLFREAVYLGIQPEEFQH